MSKTTAEAPLQLQGRIKMEIYRGGNLLSTDYTTNVITNDGLEHALDAAFGNLAASANWYCGPLKSGTPSATWDAATNLGGANNEFTDYSETARYAWTEVRTDQTVTNSAAKAKYTISGADKTITGAYLVDVATKGGVTGTLFAAGNFTSARSGLQDGDEVYLTYEIQAQSA